ncbi:D-Ala-D-Ala carboxypeptidase family metallohydrolase [Sinimarinibacterium flocculans]|uniref:D-Ala-D-Ala carboxypeptidase family metallohydrolase n=1 Tax=Sinimarinibacterium flocculans TaxID=985250 RepID=UPI0024931BBA|nr:D-Ala-D-Ala carboxypeptidase family metallohydrolase [Sinimarinibacterium flocculans]
MFRLSVLLLLAAATLGGSAWHALASPPKAPVAPPDVNAGAQAAFDGAPMRIRVRGLDIAHPVFAIFALPGEAVGIDAPAGSGPYRIAAAGGRVESRVPYVPERRDQGWTWTAPLRAGLYPLAIQREADGQRIELNAFVMRPRTDLADGRLQNYRVGHYPDRPLRDNPIYLPPRGFIELTAQNHDVRVSPHFTLGEFASKQSGGYPKFLVLDERLLLALETIIDALRSAGHEASGLHVMSGYRTPFYNAAIGNVRYSLHQWGMAADVFVDEDRDGVMDDLDGDGRITRADAEVLYRVVDELHERPEYSAYVGGTGLYAPAFPRRGPFVHVDVRGWRARW